MNFTTHFPVSFCILKITVRASIGRLYRVKAMSLGQSHKRLEKAIFSVKKPYTAEIIHYGVKAIYSPKSSYSA